MLCKRKEKGKSHSEFIAQPENAGFNNCVPCWHCSNRTSKSLLYEKLGEYPVKSFGQIDCFALYQMNSTNLIVLKIVAVSVSVCRCVDELYSTPSHVAGLQFYLTTLHKECCHPPHHQEDNSTKLNV